MDVRYRGDVDPLQWLNPPCFPNVDTTDDWTPPEDWILGGVFFFPLDCQYALLDLSLMPMQRGLATLMLVTIQAHEPA